MPLCADCHGLVERRDPTVCRALMLSLTDAEYSWLLEAGGETVLERRYGLRYSRG